MPVSVAMLGLSLYREWRSAQRTKIAATNGTKVAD